MGPEYWGVQKQPWKHEDVGACSGVMCAVGLELSLNRQNSPNPSYALLVKDKLFIVPGIQMPFLVLRSVYASRTTGRTSCILTYVLHGIWEEECKNMSNLKYRALLNQTLRAVQLNKEKYRSLMF